MASRTTGETGCTDKRLDYERFGIAEYWRFDPSGGEYHDAALAGDRLADGGYEPIEMEWLDEMRGRGYSDVLSLYICWEDRDLHWFDPVAESYLRTFTEERERADTEAICAARAERHAAEERDREATVRRQAEAENRRLRERLDALGEVE